MDKEDHSGARSRAMPCSGLASVGSRGEQEGWSQSIVRGKTETDAARASRLSSEMQYDQMSEPEQFVDEFRLVETDERTVLFAATRPRIGQGTTRTRLPNMHGRKCAVTGEKTEPVLEAAHVQSYLGPRSNHVQNGILVTQEFHTLFDAGLVSITPEYKVRVSPAIREKWSNGRRFYEYDGRPILVPEDPELRPSHWLRNASLGPLRYYASTCLPDSHARAVSRG